MHTKFSLGNVKGTGQFDHLCVDGRRVKLILNKLESSGSGQCPVEGFENSNEALSSRKGREFFSFPTRTLLTAERSLGTQIHITFFFYSCLFQLYNLNKSQHLKILHNQPVNQSINSENEFQINLESLKSHYNFNYGS